MLDKRNRLKRLTIEESEKYFCKNKTDHHQHHLHRPHYENIRNENISSDEERTNPEYDGIKNKVKTNPLNGISTYRSNPNCSYGQIKRLRANDRERRRVYLINCAMENLRDVIPGLKERRKLTKLELLRAANQYIWILDEALRTGKSVEELFTLLEKQPVVYCVSYACMPVLKREPSD